MDIELELQTMAQIDKLLSQLEEESVHRVMQWVASRYGIALFEANRARSSSSGINIASSGVASGDFQDLPSFFVAASPLTEPEKVLVVGYWFQQSQGQESLDSQQINSELKNLGHGIKNITNAFTSLMEQKPQLAIQIRKSGSSQQARKKYKLTTAGIHKVESMLTRNSESDV